MRTMSGLYRRKLRGTLQIEDDRISAYPCANEWTADVGGAQPVPLDVGQLLEARGAEGGTLQLPAKVFSSRTRLLVHRRPA